jgi:Short C-terminal domain
MHAPLEGDTTMSDAVVIVAEIIVGLTLLTVVGGAMAVFVPRLQGKTSPADILRERYARGELTREQYEQVRQDLALPSMFGEVLQAPQPNGREEADAGWSEKSDNWNRKNHLRA